VAKSPIFVLKDNQLEMTKELTLTQTENVVVEEASIILFNDDVNTFDYVINSLMEICEHSPTQAEQCALIVHMKGKYAVLSGEKRKMVDKCIALLDRGLSAELA
jgi:ATP-dependent Clp protease adaptor protein ClpS